MKIQDFDPTIGFSMGAIIISIGLIIPDSDDFSGRLTLVVLGITCIITTLILMWLKKRQDGESIKNK